MPARLFVQGCFFAGSAVVLTSLAASAQEKPWTTGTKSLIVMRFDLSEAPGDPVQSNTLKKTFEEVNEFFKINSRGKFAVEPTITPTLRLPRPRSVYVRDGGSALKEDAYDTMRRAALHPDRYELEIIATPRMSDPFGEGTFGKRGLLLQGEFSWRTIAQELCTNLGLGSSDVWRPSGEDPIGPGKLEAYKDPFDFLGAQRERVPGSVLNAAHKFAVGWLTEAEVPLVTKSGKYKIAPHDTATDTTAIKGVRIPRTAGGYYVLEYRPSLDSPRLKDGVLFYRTGEKPGSSQLLIMTPELTEREEFGAAPLLTGHTFEDKANNTFITPIRSANNRSMDVAVNIGPFPNNKAPEVEIGADKWEGVINEPMIMAGIGKDEDGDELAYRWDFGDGERAGNEQKVTHTWKVPGVHIVKCHVTDMKGGKAVYEGEFTITGEVPTEEQPQNAEGGEQPQE